MRLPADTSRWRLLFSILSTQRLDSLPNTRVCKAGDIDKEPADTSFCAKTPAHWARITRLASVNILFITLTLREDNAGVCFCYISLFISPLRDPLKPGPSANRCVSGWQHSWGRQELNTNQTFAEKTSHSNLVVFVYRQPMVLSDSVYRWDSVFFLFLYLSSFKVWEIEADHKLLNISILQRLLLNNKPFQLQLDHNSVLIKL